MSNFKTDQEHFWAGNFGDEYVGRNNDEALISSRIVFWGSALKCANGIKSIKEFGCNIGLNLLALKRLNPSFELCGVEINQKAAKQAQALCIADIQQGSILDPMDDESSFDLTFTAGVLIHINPESLNYVYENLVRVSSATLW